MSYTVSRQSIEHQSRARTFTMVAPETSTPDAVVVYFHGSLQSSNVARNFTGHTFDALTERNVLVAYPDGVYHHFNDARRDFNERTRQLRIDDVGFTRQLIEQLRDSYGISADRVFGCGFSNGGQMVLRLLHDAPGLLAGAATFAATMPTADNFFPSIGHPDPVPTPFLSIHGTADPISPYSGGEVGLDDKKRGAVRSLRATGEYFAHVNGFGSAAPERLDRGEGVTIERWAGDAPPVEVWSVEGMGHLVPSPKVLDSRLGATTSALIAADITANFFGL